jgi:hypothetical protein
MQRVFWFGSVLAALALCAACNSGCGGGSDTSASPGDVNVTNVTPAATLSGSWNGTFSPGGAFTLHLTQSGDAITGTITIDSATVNVTGNISGDTVTLTGSVGENTYTLTGNANSSRNSMTGNYTAAVPVGPPESGTWSANK